MSKVSILNYKQTEEPWQPDGKKWTLYKWQVGGAVDNVPVDHMIISTLSKKLADTINANKANDIPTTDLEIKEDKFNKSGVREIQLQTPDGDGYSGGGKKDYVPYGKPYFEYTLNEHDKLFEHSFALVKALCLGAKCPFVHELVSSHFIGAQKQGIKIKE